LLLYYGLVLLSKLIGMTRMIMAELCEMLVKNSYRPAVGKTVITSAT
jgi:hypothetical protein